MAGARIKRPLNPGTPNVRRPQCKNHCRRVLHGPEAQDADSHGCAEVVQRIQEWNTSTGSYMVRPRFRYPPTMRTPASGQRCAADSVGHASARRE